MGGIADMMIEGVLCACCGKYLGEEVGYPCYCKECAEDMKKDNPDEDFPLHPDEEM